MGTLALLGGKPVKERIGEYASWPVGCGAERDALRRALHSGRWGTLGPECIRFADTYARYCQTRHALPVCNGTVSLELIFRALNIGRGDEVIVPPYTFVASVTAIAMVGAMPVFADIEADSFNIDAARIQERITDRTRAILGVHLGGRPFDVDAVGAVAKEHGLHLIEDAAHAPGSEWRGKRVGGLADCGSFSFQASKNLSSGEGGAITTDDGLLYERLWGLHNGGRPYGEFGDDFPLLGTNARLAEWQAAMLNAHIQRLDADTERRMQNAAILDAGFAEFPFLEPLRKDERITRNSLHLYPFRFKREGLAGVRRGLFLRALEAENVCIAAQGYSSPIYDMALLHTPDFEKASGRKFENPRGTLPVNERIAREEGMWFYHSALLGEPADTQRILDAMGKIYENRDALRKMEGEENA